MPVILGAMERRPALDAGGRPALPAGTTFDPRPVEQASPAQAPPVPAPPAGAPGQPEVIEVVEEVPVPVPPPDPAPTPPPEPPPPVPQSEEPDGPDRGGFYSGPQLIAMRLGDHGVKDRDARLRIVQTILKRPDLASSKDLSAREIAQVLAVINTDGYQPDPELTANAAPPGPGRRPEEWTGNEWLSFLDSRRVTHAQLIAEAATLAAENNRPAPVSLDQLAGSGLADLLVGFCEDEQLGGGQ
jgi:hypothetical protein